MGLHRLGDLEVSQDLDFEHRSWRVQRIGWVLFSLVLLAALLGLLGGPGPLSTTTAGEGSPLEVVYERFARHNNPTELMLQLQPGAVPGDEVRVWVNTQYLEAIQIERIEPEPNQVEISPQRITYVFPLSDSGAGGRVVLHLMPQAIGRHEVRMGVEGELEHRFTQIIYP